MVTRLAHFVAQVKEVEGWLSLPSTKERLALLVDETVNTAFGNTTIDLKEQSKTAPGLLDPPIGTARTVYVASETATVRRHMAKLIRARGEDHQNTHLSLISLALSAGFPVFL